ncbi:hypothetical protein ES703_26666 [subsurface metagenome]
MMCHSDQGKKRPSVRKLAFLLLTSVIVFVALSPGPVGVAAQEPDLRLLVDGKEGAEVETYFDVGDLAPCASGSGSIKLKNIGTDEGALLFRITDLIDEENEINEPESAVDTTPYEGELCDNLYVWLTTDSTTLGEGYASDLEGWEQFIGLLPSGAETTIQIIWSVGCDVGNIIQTDICIFDMQFILTAPLPPILELSNLQVPEKGYYCESIDITVDARNVGHYPGDFDITMVITDEEGEVVVEETISVTLDPFKRVTVPFPWHPIEGGSIYTVTINGLSGTIEVLRAPELEYSNLVISPRPANVCHDVTISADVHNIGDETGTFTVIATVDGWSDSQIVTVDPCETVTVDFTWHADEAGSYTVMVGPLEGGLTVIAPTPTPTPPPGGGGGGGGGGAPPRLTLDVDMWGKVTSGDRTAFGILIDTIEALSDDGVVALLIREGTEVVDPEGNAIDLITVEPVEALPPLPPGSYAIDAYDFIPPCTFEPAVELIMVYDEEALPEGFDEVYLVIQYYREDEGGWRELPTVVDTFANTVNSLIGHLTIFAIVARVPELTITGLSVSPIEVDPEEEVTITVGVENTGATPGSQAIELWIEGEFEDSQPVTLDPGAVESVTFTVSREESGIYRVAVDGFRGEFEVVGVPGFCYWCLIVGLLGGLLLAGALAYLLLRWRAAERKRHGEVTGGQL